MTSHDSSLFNAAKMDIYRVGNLLSGVQNMSTERLKGQAPMLLAILFLLFIPTTIIAYNATSSTNSLEGNLIVGTEAQDEISTGTTPEGDVPVITLPQDIVSGVESGDNVENQENNPEINENNGVDEQKTPIDNQNQSPETTTPGNETGPVIFVQNTSDSVKEPPSNTTEIPHENNNVISTPGNATVVQNQTTTQNVTTTENQTQNITIPENITGGTNVTFPDNETSGTNETSQNITEPANGTGSINGTINETTQNETVQNGSIQNVTEQNGTEENESDNIENEPEPGTEPSINLPAVIDIELFSPSRMTRGEKAVFSVNVTNVGLGNAENVFFSWSLPDGFEIISGGAIRTCGTLESGEICTSQIEVLTSLETGLGARDLKIEVKYE